MKGDPRDATPATSKLYQDSLANWGGWSKLTMHEPRALLESISKSIDSISRFYRETPPNVGTLPSEEWTPIAEVLSPFLTAYLNQELNRILNGPGDLITALRLVNSSQAGRFLLAVVLVAREHVMQVEIIHRSPYSDKKTEDNRDLSNGQWVVTLTIRIAHEHGEESIPVLLHYHGEEYLWDKSESTPGKPVRKAVSVDRKLAVFFDASDYGDITLDQHQRDSFLKRQGFEVARFSPLQIEKDVFACAAESVKILSGKVFPPPK